MVDKLMEEKVEILLIPSSWFFNFSLIEHIIDFSMKYIPTLKCVIFSNTQTMAVSKTRIETKRIENLGWIDVEI